MRANSNRLTELGAKVKGNIIHKVVGTQCAGNEQYCSSVDSLSMTAVKLKIFDSCQ